MGKKQNDITAQQLALSIELAAEIYQNNRRILWINQFVVNFYRIHILLILNNLTVY